MRIPSATCLLLACVSAALGEHVDLLDSTRIEGRVISITDKHATITSDGQEQKIELRDVAEVKLSDASDVMAKVGQEVLCTTAGDTLAVSSLSVQGGHVSFTMPLLGEARLPMAAAAVFYQPPQKTTAEELRVKCREMKLGASTSDMLVVVGQKGNWLTATGLLQAVSERDVAFRWNDKDSKFDRSAVQVIFFGKVAAGRQLRAGAVVLIDGSIMGFESVSLDGGWAVVRTAGIGQRKIERERLAAIRFESDRIVKLTDLKPASLKEYGVLKTFPHRVDRSVGGGPLSLGGRTYETGLGLHSFCELSYQLDGQFGTFVAVVGIDDAIRPGGDAVLTFLGDGKELGKPLRLTGREAPKTVRLDVSRVGVLTVRVEFGEYGLDSGDHVDIAAARLIK